MKKLISALLALLLVIGLCGCAGNTTTTLGTVNPDETQENVPRLSFIADFYTNDGTPWLSVEGSTFNISPNKVKEYSWNSDGKWISQWTMSSVMTIKIDNSEIESCGSTVIFSDSSLERYEVELPEEVVLSEGGDSSISVPSELRFKDYWSVKFWWYHHQSEGRKGGSKIVIIQSQTGEPICMYTGDNVTWEVTRNLPKTTLVNIDGKALYIHRANFAIVDTSIFGG